MLVEKRNAEDVHGLGGSCFMPVTTDHMTAWRELMGIGDLAAVRPASRFEGDGVYAIDKGGTVILCYLTAVEDNIAVCFNNTRYQPDLLKRRVADAAIRGRVFGVLKVTDKNMLEEMARHGRPFSTLRLSAPAG